ncbi:MAG: hypothetical protein ACKPGB_24620, partial [Dolichospermum sp.]
IEELLTIAQNQIPESQQELHFQLLEKNQNNQLSESDRLLLKSLRVSADYLMLKKAYAYALLKWQGFSLPDLAHRLASQGEMLVRGPSRKAPRRRVCRADGGS